MSNFYLCLVCVGWCLGVYLCGCGRVRVILDENKKLGRVGEGTLQKYSSLSAE